MLLGAAIGVITAVAVTWWANHKARKLAHETGAFARPDLSVWLFGCPLHSPAQEFVIRHPAEKGKVILPFRVQVRNRGARTADKAVLTIQANQSVLVSKDDLVEHEIIPGVLGPNVDRSINDIGEFRQVSFRLPPIHPRSSAIVSEPFILDLTSMTVPVQAKTKDQFDISMNVQVDYSYVVGVTVFLNDVPPIQASARISCLAAPSLDSLIEARRKSISDKFVDRVSGWPFWRRHLMWLLRREVTTVYFLELGPTTEHSVQGKTVYLVERGEAGVRTIIGYARRLPEGVLD